jgi:protein TonB
MLAYAAKARVTAARRPAPQAMLLIVAGHVAMIALVMSAKMELPERIQRQITRVHMIPLPAPPPPPQPRTIEPPREPTLSTPYTPPTIVPVPQPPREQPMMPSSQLPSLPSFNVGPALDPRPIIHNVPSPVRLGPRLATAADELRPPYPASKLAFEEEAVLRLRLTIDARGRVTAVDPIGRADPAFLQAARRHLTARWRYVPASEDGRAIASTTTITLRFELS